MEPRSRAWVRFIVIAVSVALLLPAVATAAPATDSSSPQWQQNLETGFDAAVLRPLGMIALVVGGAFVVPIALVTWPTGTSIIERAVDRFVTTPAQDLFDRPLGEF
jgi:hypothetical protein